MVLTSLDSINSLDEIVANSIFQDLVTFSDNENIDMERLLGLLLIL